MYTGCLSIEVPNICDLNSVRHRDVLHKPTGGVKIYVNYRSELRFDCSLTQLCQYKYIY